jgi:hypothetical protein
MEIVKKTILPLLLALLVACSWLNPFDSIAIEKVDAGLKRALISFGSARALNAVVSVIQETDVSIEPGGVGVKLAPGQVLDPVNDLVEKFSNLMLVASISFGIQHILLSIGGHWLMSLALTSVTVLWGVCFFRRSIIPAWATKLLVITIVVRFAVPTVTMGTAVLFQSFLEKEYSTGQTLIETSAADAKKIMLQGALPESSSIWDKMKNLNAQDFNVAAKIERLMKAAEQWPEQIIRLMVVFLLQTLIMPLALLWGLLALVKSVFGMQFLSNQNRVSSRQPDLEPKSANPT